MRPGGDAREALGDGADDRVIGAALDEETASGRAGLAAVLDDGAHQHRRGLGEVGIGEDELRRLAAELERAADVVLRRRRLDQRADLGAAGERDEIDAGVARERRARLLAQSRDDVQRALRKADLERELGDADEREPGVLGGLDDAGVAAGKRRPDRAAEDLRSGSSTARCGR